MHFHLISFIFTTDPTKPSHYPKFRQPSLPGRSTDLVARYGGEEFVCLLPESDISGATTKAELLRKAVENLHIPHEGSATASHVTISIGAASRIPDEHTESKLLISDADEALYKAKHRGRNCVYSAAISQS